MPRCQLCQYKNMKCLLTNIWIDWKIFSDQITLLDSGRIKWGLCILRPFFQWNGWMILGFIWCEFYKSRILWGIIGNQGTNEVLAAETGGKSSQYWTQFCLLRGNLDCISETLGFYCNNWSFISFFHQYYLQIAMKKLRKVLEIPS